MLLSLRIDPKDHMDQAYIDALINTLVECGPCFDEVWIATLSGSLTEKSAGDVSAATMMRFKTISTTA